MNDETRILNASDYTAKACEVNNNKAKSWKRVTIGGFSGILVGAGAVYAATQLGKDENSDVAENNTESASPSNTTEHNVPVANDASANDGTFEEAFNAAREAVGPGGVFYWRGGVYGTYTQAEWDAMQEANQERFVSQVEPEVSAGQVQTPTTESPDVIYTAYHGEVTTAEIEEGFGFGEDSDVSIVGVGTVEGHVAVGYDVTGNEEADVAVVDMDDNLRISDPDVVIDRQGNMATVGDIVNQQSTVQPDVANYVNEQPNYIDSDPVQPDTYIDNPDVAPDMPDYSNDANIDYIDV